VRDWLAFPVDFAMDPLFVAGILVRGVIGTGVIDVVNQRAINDEQIEENRREAIDWYVFVRDVCLQDREGSVRGDGARTAEEEEDLYDFEE
jgi:ABC-type transporter lipoprotein component MlaA